MHLSLEWKGNATEKETKAFPFPSNTKKPWRHISNKLKEINFKGRLSYLQSWWNCGRMFHIDWNKIHLFLDIWKETGSINDYLKLIFFYVRVILDNGSPFIWNNSIAVWARKKKRIPTKSWKKKLIAFGLEDHRHRHWHSHWHRHRHCHHQNIPALFSS